MTDNNNNKASFREGKINLFGKVQVLYNMQDDILLDLCIQNWTRLSDP